ncbi:hypothetical protein KL942_001926 [Ogataea angusta]|uniref:RSE1/DDB1/CPSF1 second beta-propeller domain-containing protein n=1 Tax=Pichia angusta TaxID=870730 RepID=A0ABQ7RXT4_PICAN|nr:hypothetical protein KL942_001926 [Ogataea angusta]KAG7849911.1 hypothetical protein KL940_002279 [Ogataea angusta]
MNKSMGKKCGPFFLERTVAGSEAIKAYFSDFRVRVIAQDSRYKDLNPLNTRSKRILTSATWQDLLEPSDSMDMFSSEPDYINEVWQNNPKAPEASRLAEPEQERTMYVNIAIRNTSVSINNKDKAFFESSVLSCALIPGCLESQLEDSLLVCLENGTMLLLRVFVSGGHFEPIVVQKLRTSSLGPYEKTSMIGYKVTVHKTGKMVAIAAFSKGIRIMHIEYDSRGVPSFGSSQNMIIGGALVDTVFMEPLEPVDKEYMILVNLISTDENIMRLEYNEFYQYDNPLNSIKTHPILLWNLEEVPYFLIPTRKTQCLLQVQETKCVVHGIHYMLSRDEADVTEQALPMVGGKYIKPNSYYIPQYPITCFPCEDYEEELYDQILLSTDVSLWLLEIFGSSRRRDRRIRFSEMFVQPSVFSHFCLEEIAAKQYSLTYFNERGSAEYKIIDLVPRSNGAAFKMKVIEDKGSLMNWFPTFDYKVIPAQRSKLVNATSSEELWCVGRCESRGALFSMHKGYRAEKSIPETRFRDVTHIYGFELRGQPHFVLSSFQESWVIAFINDDDSGDITELSQFRSGQRTIYFGMLPDGRFIQIFEHGWRIGTFQSSDFLTTYVHERIILSAVWQNIVVLAYEYGDETIQVNIEAFTVSGTSLVISPGIIGIQPSLMKFITRHKQPYLAIGTYSNQIHFYRLEDHRLLLADTLDLSDRIDDFVTPHDIVYTEHHSLLTSKDGSLLLYENDKFLASLKIGELPASILQQSESKLFIVTKTLWKLDLSKSCYPERIWVAETVDRGCQAAVLVPMAHDDLLPQYEEDQLLAIRDDGLCSLFVSRTIDWSIKKVKLGSTPLKMMYYEYHNVFVVLVAGPDKLLFVDHKTKRVLAADQEEQVLAEHEQPLSISEWHVKSRRVEDYTHKHLLVGCVDKRDGSGLVKIIELKKVKDVVLLKVLYSWTQSSPVAAVAQLPDSVIIYSDRNSVRLRKYKPLESKLSDTFGQQSFPSEVKEINCVGNHVAVVTAKDSVYTYHYLKEPNGSLSPHLSDPVSRDLMGHCIIKDPYIIAADRQRQTILVIPNNTDYYASLTTQKVFEWNTPFIPRLHECEFKPLWSVPRDNTKFLAMGLNGEIRIYYEIPEHTFDKICELKAQQARKNKEQSPLLLSDIPSLYPENSPIVNVDSITDKYGEIGDFELDTLIHSTII